VDVEVRLRRARHARTGGVRDGSGLVMYTFPLLRVAARQTADVD
jgi:hypothetical protein